eukprot:1140927-Pelagomonas_calceolata.AAC.2
MMKLEKLRIPSPPQGGCAERFQHKEWKGEGYIAVPAYEDLVRPQRKERKGEGYIAVPAYEDLVRPQRKHTGLSKACNTFLQLRGEGRHEGGRCGCEGGRGGMKASRGWSNAVSAQQKHLAQAA